MTCISHIVVGRATRLGAMEAIEKAIELNPNHRDALMLKSLIVEKVGRYEEASAVREAAEFLPATNWSENVPVQ